MSPTCLPQVYVSSPLQFKLTFHKWTLLLALGPVQTQLLGPRRGGRGPVPAPLYGARIVKRLNRRRARSIGGFSFADRLWRAAQGSRPRRWDGPRFGQGPGPRNLISGRLVGRTTILRAQVARPGWTGPVCYSGHAQRRVAVTGPIPDEADGPKARPLFVSAQACFSTAPSGMRPVSM